MILLSNIQDEADVLTDGESIEKTLSIIELITNLLYLLKDSY